MAGKKKCASCGAPIEWATTEKGKRIPLDEGEFADGNLALVGGLVRAWRPVDTHLPRRRSHFASCGQASMWRKR